MKEADELPDTASSRDAPVGSRNAEDRHARYRERQEARKANNSEGGSKTLAATADVDDSTTPASTSTRSSAEASKIEWHKRHTERQEAKKKKANDDNNATASPVVSSLPTKNQEQKLRLAPGVATTDLPPSTSNQNKLRLAPGFATTTDDSPGAVRVGALEDAGDVTEDDGDHHQHDVENTLIAAEVADDMIETEVQKRLQAITAGQEEHRGQDEEPNNAATVAVEESNTAPSTVAVVVEPKSNKRLWIALAILALTAIAVTVALLTQSDESKAAVIFITPEPTKSPTESPSMVPTKSPTESPSMAPTMYIRANKVKRILADYSPLDEEALDWLTKGDTWEPDADDPNHDYLWLERYAMALLFDSTNGTSWTNSINWKTSEPVCKWYFYTQNECPGPITNLNLWSNNLKGSLPSVIGNLSQLTFLSLSDNQLTSSIPSSIGNLSQLTWLYLWSNQLTSSIPSSIGNLSQLTWLSLDWNQLTPSIPSSIGNLSLLTFLDLGGNQLTSSIPSSIGNLSQLTMLSLLSNQLTSSIPSSIGNLSQLTRLSLGNNQLTSSIPSSIGNLSQLKELWLNHNQLTSSIPSSIGNLTRLKELWLYNNKLTGSIPSLPSSITWCGLRNNCFHDVGDGAEGRGCSVTPNCAAN